MPNDASLATARRFSAEPNDNPIAGRVMVSSKGGTVSGCRTPNDVTATTFHLLIGCSLRPLHVR